MYLFNKLFIILKIVKIKIILYSFQRVLESTYHEAGIPSF